MSFQGMTLCAKDGSRLRSGQGRAPFGTPVPVLGSTQFACAAGGKGGPPPLHPRPGALPLGTPIRCIHLPNDWCACLWYAKTNESCYESLGIPEACANGQIMRLTSFAGGLGGGSPSQRGARGAEPARIHRLERYRPCVFSPSISALAHKISCWSTATGR